MSRFLDTADRWGPAALSIITFLLVIGSGWYQSDRISRLEGVVIEQSRQDINRNIDIQTWQAYVISLQRLLVQNGIKVPDAPKPASTNTNTNHTTNTQRNETNKKGK